MVFESLINSIAKIGASKVDICGANFNCEPSKIQKDVIIAPTWEVNIFKNHVDKIIEVGNSGRGFSVYEIHIKDKKLTYVNTNIGACNILDATLSLGCTPCQNIIFVGSVGALSNEMNIGDIIVPKYSICGVGTNRYLNITNYKEDPFNKYYPNKKSYLKLLSIANEVTRNSNIKNHIGHTYTMDTIFAEYYYINEIIKIGCNSIEMETATFFHASNIANLNSCALFGVSDNVIINKSLYCGRNTYDRSLSKKVKNEVIPKIILEYFNIK